MNTIRLVGQVITSTNYTAQRLFNFNPEPIREAAENFLASGIPDIEIPEAVLDPDGKFNDTTGIDEETLKKTLAGLPKETRIIASYIGASSLGSDNAAYVKRQKRTLSGLVEHLPDVRYAMLHPVFHMHPCTATVREIVEAYAELAEHVLTLRSDFQLCFHNHYDTNAESADQVREFLKEIEDINSPGLRWGPDTGHCHGMGDEFLEVLKEYSHLLADYFHIKARAAVFDRLHGKEEYREDRDIWSNKAEVGGGLYAGFINPADPEITTPFKEVFDIMREKKTATDGIVYGAMEIDIPRQHPRLEALCGALYYKNVHNVVGALDLSNDEIIARALGLTPISA